MKTQIRSFTLIEVIVVFTIIVLLTGLSLATYNNFTQQKNLERELNRLIDVLSLAKAKAQASDINFECDGVNPDDEFGGYRVEVSFADYNLKQLCRDSSTKILTNPGPEITSYNFPSNVNKSSGDQNTDFYPLSGGASISTITIRNSTIKKCITISITNTGIIEAGNPIAC